MFISIYLLYKRYRQLDIQRTQIGEQEKRKTLQEEVETSKRREEYRVQLELQRDQEKMKRQQEMMEQNRLREEESVQRQEAIKRQTLQHEYEMKLNIEKEKVEYEVQRKMEMKRQNRDIMEDMIRLQEHEKRKTMAQMIRETFGVMGNGLMNFISSPKLVTKTLLYTFAFLTALHGMKTSLNVLGAAIMSRFGKPTLLRETSRIVASNILSLPFLYARHMSRSLLRRSQKDMLSGVILEPILDAQLKNITYSVLNRKKHYAPYRNFLFYGPPGTGKTLFAKKLAIQSGMEYAIMTGSDISPLAEKGVTELNKIFDWSEKTRNGVILFIDEADAFLRKRKGDDKISENLRNAINGFLYRTGSQSEKFMLVMATNNPDQLDEAIFDRTDELVLFEKPKYQERINMLYHYLLLYCNPPKSIVEKLNFFWKHPKSVITGKKLIRMEDVDHDVIEEMAKQSGDFSGRELAKMVVAWHDAAFALEDPVLTPQLMEKVLVKFRQMHTVKVDWTQQESELLSKLHNPELIAKIRGEKGNLGKADTTIIDTSTAKGPTKEGI